MNNFIISQNYSCITLVYWHSAATIPSHPGNGCQMCISLFFGSLRVQISRSRSTRPLEHTHIRPHLLKSLRNRQLTTPNYKLRLILQIAALPSRLHCRFVHVYDRLLHTNRISFICLELKYPSNNILKNLIDLCY